MDAALADRPEGYSRPVEDAHGHVPHRWRWLAIALATLGAIAGIAVAVSSLVDDSEPTPGDDPFYAAPEPLPTDAAGTIIRAETLRSRPPDASTYRILYLSRGHDGRRVALSALLFVPERPAPSNRRSIVAVAHGTVGVARGCAPSLGSEFLQAIDGLARFLRAGHAVVVPDGEGLGTTGTQPYLVGEASAHALLDAVRAARQFPAADASQRFAVWGVGEGGQAALFTGQEAARYAPELELAGVAAAAPMANLRRLLDASAGSPAGDVMAAYMLATWRVVYPQLDVGAIVTDDGRRTVDELSGLCVPLDRDRIGPTLEDREITLEYRRRRPWNDEPWRELLAGNAPGTAPIAAPVIITQGRDDAFVRASATARFVRYLCAQGATVQYRPSRRVSHGDVGEKTAPYVARWIDGRFAGDTARSSC